jgi:2-keto-4-pentenoate hydratase/2-oxohepta-3-ene-1,7-dioic acid hydratase in catechol pathway
MHLVTFVEAGGYRIGVLDQAGDEVVDLTIAAPDLPSDMTAFIALGASGLAAARRALVGTLGRRPAAQVRCVAPIVRPRRNVFCVGKNYRAHAQEVRSLGAGGGDTQDGIPSQPIIFTKATSCVIGPGAPIPAWLDDTASVDYEGELAVVIGQGGRGIARSDALAHVYGYTIINDVTSRTLQMRHQQWFLGKSLDGFCPMGPALVSVDAVPDVKELHLQTRVNGELRQDACLADLIFDIPTLIETLSRGMTLEPGDIIATGTPAGVGMGYTPPRYLKPGDRVSVSIDPIGLLENPVE